MSVPNPRKEAPMNVVLPHRIEAMLTPSEARLDLAIGMYHGGSAFMRWR